MIGRVLKIFSDFYYVETDFGIVEAKLKALEEKEQNRNKKGKKGKKNK